MKTFSAATAQSSEPIPTRSAGWPTNSPSLSGALARILARTPLALHDLKEEISHIALDLARHRSVIFDPRTASHVARNNVGDVFRQHSIRLDQALRRAPGWLARLSKLPSRDEFSTAAENLIGLSNSVRAEDRLDYNEKRVRAIEKALHLRRT
jgi:hypothetical protein